MNLDAIMKITAEPAVEGSSSDPMLEKGIELLSFEHYLERTPVRSSRRRRDSNLMTKFGEALEQFPETFSANQRNRLTESHDRLANDLTHSGFVVFKLLDETSPLLNSWATKHESLLDTVVVTVRLPVTTGSGATDVAHQAALTITMEKVYIAEIAVVGNFNAQPWLSDAEDYPLNSAPPLNKGPVERVQFCYQTIKWSYGDMDNLESGVANALRPKDTASPDVD